MLISIFDFCNTNINLSYTKGYCMNKKGGHDSDEQLTQQVSSLLKEDKDLGSYGINARVVAGEAQLQGIVDTLKEKQRLENLVRRVPGVKSVANAVAVSTDGAIRDADVTMEVNEELDVDPRVDLRHIGAESVGGDGTVILKGRTDRPEELTAARKDAAKSRGVTKVVSQVKIGDEEPSLEDIFHNQVANDDEER